MRRREVKTKEGTERADSDAEPTEAKDSPSKQGSQMLDIFGFEWQDFTSWSSFVGRMSKPLDPASLGILRISFGVLMFLDIFHERGFQNIDQEYAEDDLCRFPLFNFLRPLSLEWMYMVYLTMVLGAVGIALGLFYRLSCLLFIVPYWYIFFLNKSSWNNHTYLYGLFSLLFLVTDANRYWSIDGLIWPKIRQAHVPTWNYCLFRYQIFLVYFYAGLKKLDADWRGGYSMQHLGNHWVFAPFQGIMTVDQIDFFLVHWGGLLYDLFVGFIFFFDKTRPLAFIFCSAFNGMNSQMFSIGMFSYTMLAVQPIFCYPDWPRRIFNKLPRLFGSYSDVEIQPSTHCLYTKEQIKTEKKVKVTAAGDGSTHETTKSPKQSKQVVAKSKAGIYHQLMVAVAVIYMGTQAFLPYSHFITKGYNNWTNGLYGYSWDMMVHSWANQHLRLEYVNKDNGQRGYLNPMAWVPEDDKRWSSHADMLKQYAVCVSQKLRKHKLTNVELYFDVWRSLNDRFQQRIFDPRVDIVAADWSPFQTTPWVLPLLVDLSDWRAKLDEITTDLLTNSNDTDVVFVADFPGLHLENFLQEDLKNTSITILQGEVLIELVDQKKNLSLKEGGKMQLPAGEFHNVHTVSETPSCYMYLFVNATQSVVHKHVLAVDQWLNTTNKNLESYLDYTEVPSDIINEIPGEMLMEVMDLINKKREKDANEQKKFNARFTQFWVAKYRGIARAMKMTWAAGKGIWSGVSMLTILNTTLTREEQDIMGVSHLLYEVTD